MSTWNSLNFQDSASPLMEQLTKFHDYTMIFMIIILMYIFFMIFIITTNKLTDKNILDNQFIEIIWTSIPMAILMFIALPSLKILYLTDETLNSKLNIKVTGHQWYWSYNIAELNNQFDSFLNNSLKINSFRNLDTDNFLILPNNLTVNLIISSTDVIHSWTVPSLGIKIDAVPGRLNQTPLLSNRCGLFFGQCSEICGINHSFMPIVIEITSLKKFNKLSFLH
uniref:Cytochrome c oxidase subunit 2 n=1 Tax=Prosevania sp. ZJUH_2016031 TaxID=2491170 RepID=A0A3S8V1B7_9HYME|nr:cytochrome c oxidase subunit 2 [Prosevania sp. ZJUH_2016031]